MKDPAWIETVSQTDWEKDPLLNPLLDQVKDKESGLVDHIMACLLYTSDAADE